MSEEKLDIYGEIECAMQGLDQQIFIDDYNYDVPNHVLLNKKMAIVTLMRLARKLGLSISGLLPVVEGEAKEGLEIDGDAYGENNYDNFMESMSRFDRCLDNFFWELVPQCGIELESYDIISAAHLAAEELGLEVYQLGGALDDTSEFVNRVRVLAGMPEESWVEDALDFYLENCVFSQDCLEADDELVIYRVDTKRWFQYENLCDFKAGNLYSCLISELFEPYAPMDQVFLPLAEERDGVHIGSLSFFLSLQTCEFSSYAMVSTDFLKNCLLFRCATDELAQLEKEGKLILRKEIGKAESRVSA